MKEYDRDYYDHWYRTRAAPVTRELLSLKVRHAVSAAEFVLGREIRSVLDVGCGEARWRSVLRRMRPDVRYLGVDGSDYVVQRFGKERNIRKGTLGKLGEIGLRRKFDLIVCADVIMYVPTPELRRGLAALRKLLHGMAYIEVYATGDEVEGDLEGWIWRSERFYRREFATAGFISCGLNCWLGADSLNLLSALERCR